MSKLETLLVLFGFIGGAWFIAVIGRRLAELQHEIEKCKMVQISQQKTLDKLTQEQPH